MVCLLSRLVFVSLALPCICFGLHSLPRHFSAQFRLHESTIKQSCVHGPNKNCFKLLLYTFVAHITGIRHSCLSEASTMVVHSSEKNDNRGRSNCETRLIRQHIGLTEFQVFPYLFQEKVAEICKSANQYIGEKMCSHAFIRVYALLRKVFGQQCPSSLLGISWFNKPRNRTTPISRGMM